MSPEPRLLKAGQRVTAAFWTVLIILAFISVAYLAYDALFGGGEDVSSATDAVPSDRAGDCAKDGKFCGDLKQTYEIAYTGCSAFTREELRDQLGAATTNAADIGEAFADAYQDWARQAAFEGCVDAVFAGG